MDSRTSSKVGLTIVAALALFFYAWRFFAHLHLDHYALYADFQNTSGLQPEAVVHLNGVPVGEVESIALSGPNLEPRVKLSIANRYRIPRDWVVQITSGLLINNPEVEITPPGAAQPIVSGTYGPDQTWDPRFVQKAPAVGLAQLSPDADKALKQLTATV